MTENETQKTDEDRAQGETINLSQALETFKKVYEREHGIPLDRVEPLPPPPKRPPLLQGPGGRKTVWHPVPGNLCAEIRFALADFAEKGDQFAWYGDIPRYRRHRLGCFYAGLQIGDARITVRSGYPKPPIEEFIRAVPFASRKDDQADIYFCALRDPVERWKKYYAEKIVFHRIFGDEIPSADDAASEIASYAEKDEEARPQTFFLGDDASYYTHAIRVENRDEITAILSKACERDVTLPDLPPPELPETPNLSAKAEANVKTFYESDYRVFGEILK